MFVVPCDSHEIQLFLKDVFQISWWRNLIHKAQLVVRTFRTSHKEYQVLQEIQVAILGKRIALILHCITRWGTQVRLLNALYRSCLTIQEYSQQSNPQIDKNKKADQRILPILRDSKFWQDVTTARRILTPIHEIQYLSEADNYPLYRVLDNWMLIKQSLMKSATEYGTVDYQLSFIVETLWDQRYLTQITELHVIATLLIPRNYATTSVGQTSKIAFEDFMTRFFQQYASPNQLINCMRDFWAFRARKNAFFSHEASVWTYIEDPVVFWETAAKFTPVLGDLAGRLMQVPGNSVPGERAWSIQNLILIKTRNEIKDVNMNRLLYIYINERVLNRPPNSHKKKLPYTHGILISDEELAELKDLMLRSDDVEEEFDYVNMDGEDNYEVAEE